MLSTSPLGIFILKPTLINRNQGTNGSKVLIGWLV